MAQQETRIEFEQDVRVTGVANGYHAQWRAFAFRRGLALFLLYTWLPASIAFFEVSRRGLHQPLLFGGLICLWLVLALAAVWWAGEFRCPRCQRRYAALGHRKGDIDFTRGLFDKVCANCKLTKLERAG